MKGMLNIVSMNLIYIYMLFESVSESLSFVVIIIYLNNNNNNNNNNKIIIIIIIYYSMYILHIYTLFITFTF